MNTPAIVIDLDRLERNLARMQGICDRHGVELRPHIKTHKMVEVARRQLSGGAAGLTCAKLSEAEAMLPAEPKSLFIAHSLVDAAKASRLRAVAERVDELIVACTSEKHLVALEELLVAADLRLPVMMAVDSGLHREGTRGEEAARRLAGRIARSPRMELRGIYTHEGHAYAQKPEALDRFVTGMHERLIRLRDSIDPDLRLWPGCTVTAPRFAALPGVQAVRPGAYVFGDLSQAVSTQVIDRDDVALHVHAQVVDRPSADLALIDAGSKVFSSDKTADGLTALAADGRDLHVLKCNEEHGYLTGPDAAGLEIGQIVAFIPAHVCPVVNLADRVHVVRNGQVIDRWTVDARGCVT